MSRSAANSRLDHYVRNKKILLTRWNAAFENAPEMHKSRWIDTTFPDYLWAVLIRTTHSESDALEYFRHVITEWPQRFTGRAKRFAIPGSHTAIARTNSVVRDRVIALIMGSLPNREALRPLLLLEHLPAYKSWASAIGSEPNPEDWVRIAESIYKGQDFHSDVVTDVCWLMTCLSYKSGQSIGPTSLLEEMAIRNNEYPSNRSESGGFFRCHEMSMRMPNKSQWPTRFWSDVYGVLPPQHAHPDLNWTNELAIAVSGLLGQRIAELEMHFWRTRTKSDDEIHSIVFGFCHFGAMLAYELVDLQAAGRSVAMPVIRSMVEGVINLSYLMTKDDPSLWRRFRDHGYGQARLIVEKVLAQDNPPSIVDYEWIHAFSQEQQRAMLTNIELGDWSGTDLRKRAEDSGTKDLYDLYYDYTSAFAHANWLGIASLAMTWDLNPLHRLQQVPRGYPRQYPNALPDAFRILNRYLELLNSLYPGGPASFPEIYREPMVPHEEIRDTTDLGPGS